jgi:DNA polymerase-3 subunit delta
MVYLIVGTNSYIVEQEVRQLAGSSSAIVERIDSSVLSQNNLADLMRGGTLFADERTVVLANLSERKELWEKMAQWLDDVPDTTTLILIEAKPDRRTKAYKAIVARARVIEATPLADRDWRKAEAWLAEYARERKVRLSADQVRNIVHRAYVPDTKPGRQIIDQQMIATAIDALAVMPEVGDDAIETVMATSSQGTLFDVLQYALSGERARAQDLLRQLKRQDDPHAVFPTLMTQWVQLLEVALTNGRGASQLGIHPYVVQKLEPLARGLDREQLHALTELGARLDADMKRSAIEPWDAVDRFVLELTMTN